MASVRESSQDGYAAVDAMVALAILATVLGLSVQLSGASRKASAHAAELLDVVSLMRTTPSDSGLPDAGGGVAVVETTDELRVGELVICRRQIEVRSEMTRRTYRQTTRVICPANDGGDR